MFKKESIKHLAFCMGISLLVAVSRINGQDADPAFKTRVTLRPQRTGFYTRTPVWIFIRIENNDPDGPRLVNCPLDDHFFISDEAGNPLSLGSPQNRCRSGRRMQLGEVLEDSGNVSKSYFVIGKRDPFLPPGRYRVQFQWLEPGHALLASDPVTFQVSDPKGDEKKALRLLHLGDRHYRLKELKASDDCYRKLVEKYPHSMYAANALELLFRNHKNRYHREDAHIRMHTAKRLLEDYPEAEFNIGSILYTLEEDYRREDKIEEFMSYLGHLMDKQTNPRFVAEMEKTRRRLHSVTSMREE